MIVLHLTELLTADFQPDQWEEYQRTKQKDSSDSEDEEDQEKNDSDKKKTGQDQINSSIKVSKLTIDLDEDIPLSKVKEILARYLVKNTRKQIYNMYAHWWLSWMSTGLPRGRS